jgi:hypothetical protein
MSAEQSPIQLEQIGWVQPTPLTGRLIFQPIERPPTALEGWEPVYRIASEHPTHDRGRALRALGE